MNETPYPSHWQTTCLSNEKHFQLENGIWKGKKEPFIECAVIRNTNFSNDGFLDLSDVAIIPIEKRQFNNKRLQWGDIIVERSGGGPQQPVGRVVFFGQNDGDYCFSNFTSRIRVADKDAIDPYYIHSYLFYFHLSGRTERLQRRTTGIRNLSFGDYITALIPLPPLAEQKAIAAALRAVQEAMAARRQEAALERERKAALMQHLFTHGTQGEEVKDTAVGQIPASWAVAQLGRLIVDGPQNGLYKPQEAYGAGVPIVRINDFDNDGKFVNLDFLRVTLSPEELDKYLLNENDIVINRVNSLSHLGKCTLIPKLREKTVFESNMMRFRVDEQRLLPQFAARYLTSEQSRKQIRNVAKRAVAQSSINQGNVKAIDVSLPELAEQREIMGLLSACENKITALEKEIALLNELFQALLEALMSGRLTVWPLLESRAE